MLSYMWSYTGAPFVPYWCIKIMDTELLMVTLLMAAAFAVHFSESVDYDDVDDAIPAEVLSEPVWTDRPEAADAPKLWSNRTAIPYIISDSLPEEIQSLIKRTLRSMERTTNACLLFKKQTDERNYLYFANITSSSSLAGMQGGLQIVPIGIVVSSDLKSGLGRRVPRYVLQRLMSSLGFQYEHQRRDRNDYIEINYDEILSGGEDEVATLRDVPTFGTKYDYQSIMHDSAFEYSKAKRPVIIPKKGLIIQPGLNLRLSPGDIAKIKVAYKCPIRISRPEPGLPQTMEPFPKFSLEPMSYDKCSLQYNDYCSPVENVSSLCRPESFRRDFQIRCGSDADATVLEQMSLDMQPMLQGEIRPVSVFLYDRVFRNYTFTPIRRQVLLMSVWNCITDRSTGWLKETNFSNLLEFRLFDCYDLVVAREDFTYSRRLRVITFHGSTIKALKRGTFDNLPDLRILSLEFLWNDSSSESEYGRFDQRMQTYLYNIHCSCEFAWFRAWWTKNKQLKIRADEDELYSIPGGFVNPAYTKEQLYHPIDCAASPFPAGTEWINYCIQIKYSVNEPKCDKVQQCQNILQALAAECF